MISVVIPTLNAEATLPDTLSALVPASVDGLVREVIVVDAGSKDGTREIADWAGADVIAAGPARGAQLAAGAAQARQTWLLFLNPDIELDPGWEREAAHFMQKVDKDPPRTAAAAVFRLALDDEGFAPRLLEGLARFRFAVLRAPCAAQGFLVPRRLFEAVGGYRDLAAGEDVDLARRLGRRRIKLLRTRAVASARSYREEGYLCRILSDQLSLVRHAFSLSPARAQELPTQGTDP
jgi:glycosyltransferase involved in cell wall biosynthesis